MIDELQKIERELEQLVEKYISGTLSVDSFHKKSRKLQKERDNHPSYKRKIKKEK